MSIIGKMITALPKTHRAAESENRRKTGEDANRLTEKQRNYIDSLFRQRVYRLPDEGFKEIAETLSNRYDSGEQLEQHHIILLVAWREKGKRRVTDLNKREASKLIDTLKSGDWKPPAP